MPISVLRLPVLWPFLLHFIVAYILFRKSCYYYCVIVIRCVRAAYTGTGRFFTVTTTTTTRQIPREGVI